MKDLKLASFNGKRTIVNIDNTSIGKGITVIAGPCAVESKEQMIETAIGVKNAGAHILRGGAFKPRTSPYSFQGLGEEGLKILQEAKQETGLPFATEVVDPRDVELVSSYADILQIGARNMQNFALLKEAGKQEKPVLLKRGISSTIEEWLYAAEYILNEGNPNVIMCERGIRTFEKYTRNTLDLNAVPALKELTHLPVIVDPSHGTGKNSLVIPMAIAGIAAGADGIIVEVHRNPSEAVSDKEQTLTIKQFEELMEKIEKIKPCL